MTRSRSGDRPRPIAASGANSSQIRNCERGYHWSFGVKRFGCDFFVTAPPRPWTRHNLDRRYQLFGIVLIGGFIGVFSHTGEGVCGVIRILSVVMRPDAIAAGSPGSERA